MHVSLTEAKAKLTDLVRRAEAGEEIVLTRHGKPAVRLEVVVDNERDANEIAARLERLREISRRGKRKALPGPPADRAADILYDEHGLPK